MSHVLIEVSRVSVDDYCEEDGVTEDRIEYCESTLSPYEWLLDGSVYEFNVWNNWFVKDWLYQESPSVTFEGFKEEIKGLFSDASTNAVALWDIYFDTSEVCGDVSMSIEPHLIGKIDLEKLPLLLMA